MDHLLEVRPAGVKGLGVFAARPLDLVARHGRVHFHVRLDAVDGAGVWLDFTHLKRQLPMSRVLDHLGLSSRLKGSGAQRRCACPIHRGDGRGRTFSVNLESNVYQCFDARCGSRGDVIDLWAALHQRDMRAAALDLVHVFGLEPCPAGGPEKRNG